jgi:alkanesulfonate monooxygenase SsuD/methylene tetrahydromethanopterin reductase-like flavin-dependent oxidoreductase (luciferase family)
MTQGGRVVGASTVIAGIMLFPARKHNEREKVDVTHGYPGGSSVTWKPRWGYDRPYERPLRPPAAPQPVWATAGEMKLKRVALATLRLKPPR